MPGVFVFANHPVLWSYAARFAACVTTARDCVD